MTSENHKTGFLHSVKVPQLYKSAFKIVKTVVEEGGSIKQLLYTTVRSNLKGVYALVTKTIQNNEQLDVLLSRTKLLANNPKLDVWLAKTLITELLLGKGCLQGESRPVQTVFQFENELRKAWETQTQEKGDETPTTTPECTKPRYVRVNTLKATCDEVIKSLRGDGWELIPFKGDYSEFLTIIAELSENQFVKDLHVKDLLVFPQRTEFHRHYLYRDGTLILQDKASCLPAILLQPSPGATVLDMCSAPGMKTTLLAALMRNKGEIYAFERNERRHLDMKKLVEAAGCSSVNCQLGDALAIAKPQMPWVDDVQFVLVDPSCSGSGMTERARLFTRQLTEDRLQQLAGFQTKLLHHALTVFPAATRVVYSTCSVYEEENEAVVAAALSRCAGKTWKIVPALPDWPSRGSSLYKFGRHCVTARPYEDLTTGFFIAVFERKKGVKVKEEVEKKIKKEEIALGEAHFIINGENVQEISSDVGKLEVHEEACFDIDKKIKEEKDPEVSGGEPSKKIKKEKHSTSVVEINLGGNGTPKKKRKKHREVEENNYNQEDFVIEMKIKEENSEESVDEGNTVKKKRKKPRELEETNLTQEDLVSEKKIKEEHSETSVDEITLDEGDTPKKKRKKQRELEENNSNQEDLVSEKKIKEEPSEASVDEITLDGNGTPKKKRKKHRDLEETNPNQEDLVSEKKIKEEHLDANVDEITLDEGDTPKKKRKKNRELEENNPNLEDLVSEKKIKKEKLSDCELEAEPLVSDENVEVESSDKKVKKRKKDKIKLVDEDNKSKREKGREELPENGFSDNNSTHSKKKKKKLHLDVELDVSNSESLERKIKNENSGDEVDIQTDESSEPKKKHKKKRKEKSECLNASVLPTTDDSEKTQKHKRKKKDNAEES